MRALPNLAGFHRLFRSAPMRCLIWPGPGCMPILESARQLSTSPELDVVPQLIRLMRSTCSRQLCMAPNLAGLSGPQQRVSPQPRPGEESKRRAVWPAVRLGSHARTQSSGGGQDRRPNTPAAAQTPCQQSALPSLMLGAIDSGINEELHLMSSSATFSKLLITWCQWLVSRSRLLRQLLLP